MVLVLSACIAILIGLASSRCPDDQQCYSMKKNLEEQNYIGLMTDINILCGMLRNHHFEMTKEAASLSAKSNKFYTVSQKRPTFGLL